MIKQTGFSFQDVDIRSIDRSQLADRSQIHIDKSMERDERIREFCRQTNYHPDCMAPTGSCMWGLWAAARGFTFW